MSCFPYTYVQGLTLKNRWQVGVGMDSDRMKYSWIYVGWMAFIITQTFWENWNPKSVGGLVKGHN